MHWSRWTQWQNRSRHNRQWNKRLDSCSSGRSGSFLAASYEFQKNVTALSCCAKRGYWRVSLLRIAFYPDETTGKSKMQLKIPVSPRAPVEFYFALWRLSLLFVSFFTVHWSVCRSWDYRGGDGNHFTNLSRRHGISAYNQPFGRLPTYSLSATVSVINFEENFQIYLSSYYQYFWNLYGLAVDAGNLFFGFSTVIAIVYCLIKDIEIFWRFCKPYCTLIVLVNFWLDNHGNRKKFLWKCLESHDNLHKSRIVHWQEPLYIRLAIFSALIFAHSLVISAS